METMTINRDMWRCVLCRYWNGAIGSTTIQIPPDGNAFRFESDEKHYCFKNG